MASFQFLSTPSARRATNNLRQLQAVYYISIHALREEGDASGGQIVGTLIISIHALREEGDRRGFWGSWRNPDFYPRPPRGGRPRGLPVNMDRQNFYPRPPRGGRRPTP